MILYNIAIKEVKTVVGAGQSQPSWPLLILSLSLSLLCQVFDDVAVELAMAILQFFQSSPNEDQIFRTLKALARFLEVFDLLNHSMCRHPLTAVNSCHFSSGFLVLSQVSPDVAMIIQMIGPHPKQFAGKSERVDELIKTISRKVPA